MFFTANVDITDMGFTITFVHDDIRLDLQTLTPKLIKVPIEDEGCVKFMFSRINSGPGGKYPAFCWNEESLSWDKENFMFGCEDGTILHVPMTHKLMDSFKTAVNNWNNELEDYLYLLDA
jgi:hypothetical protein